MNIGVLGTVELWSTGNRIDSGSTRERCILAILVMTPRTQVSVDALVDRLWGAEPPPKARDDLYAYVTRIRKRLAEITDSRITLAANAGGYILDVDPEATDLHLFRLKRRQARSMAESGDVGHAATLLREAEALWRGEALAGLPGDWFARMRQSLEDERRTVTLKRIDLELDLGYHADLIGELRRLATQYELDEAVIAASMIALYRSGRVTEALTIYRETHASFTEQGMEPGAALTGLHRRILNRDPVLAITPAYRRPPGAGQPDTLPPSGGGLIGRGKEIALLAQSPPGPSTPTVWTVEGMPGVGKTALVIQAARAAAGQFPDAQLFASFRAHEPGRQQPPGRAAILSELLAGLDIPASRIPASLAQQEALWRSELANRRAVVVLDDVLGVEQVQPLLPERGACLTLITTRRRLHGLSGAAVMQLNVLPPADAATLFANVAGADKATDGSAVAKAVRLCGYLPLAIQVAASKLKNGEPGSLSELIEALTHSQDLLTPGDVIGAQVGSAFTVSYQALSPTQQHLFRLLAASPCSEVTASSAAALIAASPGQAADRLVALADDHLLERKADGRYGFHDLIRAYALERTMSKDTEADRRQAAGRVLDYYLSTAARADAMLYPHQRRRPLQLAPAAGESEITTPGQAHTWLEVERSSLVQAARYAATHERKTHCADLAHVLAAFLEAGGFWDDAMTVARLALQAARDLGDRLRTAQAQLELAHATQYAGYFDDAQAHAQHAADSFRTLGDHRGEAEALDRIGTIHDFCGRYLDALAYYDEAASIYRQAGEVRGLADAIGHVGIAHACLGHMSEAGSHLTQALTLYRQAGDRRGEARALNNLGEWQRRRGYHRDAIASYQESAEIFRQIGGRQNEAVLHNNLGIVQQYKGRYEEALASYRRALTTFRAIGDLRCQACSLNDIGAVYQAKEQHAEALAHHQKAQEIAEQIGEQHELTVALRGIGDAQAGLGSYDNAASHYTAARRLARESGDPYQEAKTIARIAEITLHTQGAEAARIHFRQALAIFEQLDVPEAEQARIRLDVLGTQPSGST